MMDIMACITRTMKKTDEDRHILKAKPFQRTSKPTHTNDESDPNRTMPRQG